MNIRKNIDYSKMYEELDMLMAQHLPQMELYCGIGKAVCRRTEKGAAVMASEYLNKQYPDVKGFSPRSLRRMRDFYRTYENYPALLSLAMQIGWIQNMVIMEAELTIELREWYMSAALHFNWSKTELINSIKSSAHEYVSLVEKNEDDKSENRVACINNYSVVPSFWKRAYKQKLSYKKRYESGLKRRCQDKLLVYFCERKLFLDVIIGIIILYRHTNSKVI